MIIHYNPFVFPGVKNPVITVGTFDGVHLGHQKIIERLKAKAAELDGETVVVTFDQHPRMVLAPDDDSVKLINTNERKFERLRSSGIQHLVILPFTLEFSRLPWQTFIKDIIVDRLGAAWLVIGYDHRFGSNREGNIETLKQLSEIYNFNVEEIPAQEINQLNVSSTRIRKAIDEGDIKTANEFLGYRFFISGTVVKGKQLGRTIGYPTANIFIEDKDKLTPKIGVYAVNVEVKGNTHKGMLNIGTNPTTDLDNTIKIEVNIFDFDKDIYGEKIKVEFVKRIRNEEKFANLDELKQALANDKIACSHV